MSYDLARLTDAIRHEGGVSRRLFLAYAASLSSLPWLGARAVGQTRRAAFGSDPFQLGVASGDPTETGVLLWTRLAPQPLEPNGGVAPENVEVAWELAADESMKQVLQRGTAVATPQLAHSVHVEVDGLEPNRWYWYRFRAGDAESPIARTRTLPTAESTPPELRFAVASCQHYEAGLYTAYRHMAEENVDLVFHLGDYIYEYGGEDGRVRKHVGSEIMSLADYRVRHSQYRSDPLLQAMHARCPWLVTWDDHEVENNYANDVAEDERVDPAAFLVRRAAAYQAYYENMPLRKTSLPTGPRLQLYRMFRFGRLAQFNILDTRQYRTNQCNGDGICDINAAASAVESSLLGATQREWLESSLRASPAAWNVLAQQVMMAEVDVDPGESRRYFMDEWPGYLSERQRLIKFFADHQVNNPVVLTGDYHANWVNNLRFDDRHSDTPVVATEFVGTSISSEGNGARFPKDWQAILAKNPCVRFFNSERGYIRCTVTPHEWRSEFRTVPYVSRPGAPIVTRATYVVESGRPGAELG
jgi:alkaline phosphatase D